MMRGYFSQGDLQQWDFSHQSLRRALKRSELDRAALVEANEGLVNYFAGCRAEPFVLREILHHLCVGQKSNLAALTLGAWGYDYAENMMQGLIDAYAEHENGADFLLAIPRAALDEEEAKSRMTIAYMLFAAQANLPGDAATRPFRIKLLLETLEILEGLNDYDSLGVRAKVHEGLSLLYHWEDEKGKSKQYIKSALKLKSQLDKMSRRKRKDEDWGEQDSSLSLAEAFDKSAVYSLTEQNYKEAEKSIKKAVDLKEKLYKKEGTLDVLVSLAFSYDLMGTTYSKLDDWDKAGRFCKKAVDAYALLRERWGMTVDLGLLPQAYQNYGVYLMQVNRGDEAAEHYKIAAVASQELFAQVGSQNLLKGVSQAYAEVVGCLEKLERKEEALEYYKKLTKNEEILYGHGDSDDELTRVSSSYWELSKRFCFVGRLSEAEVYVKKAIETFKKVYAQDESKENAKAMVTLYRSLHIVCEGLGDKLREQQKIAEALEYFKKALEAALELVNDETESNRPVMVCYAKIAECYHQLGGKKEADEYFNRASQIYDTLEK
jgi:tetratricopeptide (TPR) repeat protein